MSCRTATVLTHRRVSDTAGALRELIDRARAAGVQLRFDATETNKHRLVAEVQATFPGVSEYREINPWCGMRPATPKGAPILGATRYRNLWLNSGHGALGFTLGLGTGRVVADLIRGAAPKVPLDGFTLTSR